MPDSREMTHEEGLAGLRYIVDSPPPEHGGFHPQAVATAAWALARIAELEAAQRWVPCSERMPEAVGPWQVTVIHRRTGERHVEHHVPHLRETGFAYSPGGSSALDVIAWRPLPEPWEGE